MNLSKIRKTATLSLGRRILAGVLSTLMVVGTPVVPSFAEMQPGEAAGSHEITKGPIKINLGNDAQGHEIFITFKGQQKKLAFNGNNSYISSMTGKGILKETIRPKILEPGHSAPPDVTDPDAPTWDLISQADYDQKTPAEQADIDELYKNYESAFYRYPKNWKTPQVNIGTRTVTDVDSFSGYQNKKLFAQGFSTYTNNGEGYIRQEGKSLTNDKLDVEFIEEIVYGQEETADGYLEEVPNGVNLIVKVTNTDEKMAQMFASAWSADTQIGSDDQAPFRAPGINKFTTGNRIFANSQQPNDFGMPVGFPIDKNGTQWLENAKKIGPMDVAENSRPGLFVGDYPANKIPDFLYAIEEYTVGGGGSISSQKIQNPMTVALYPQARSSRKFDEAEFEQPAYVSFSRYTDTTGNDGYYYRSEGNGSPDSGHIVSFEPTLIMAGETKYFGSSYGTTKSDEVNPNGISLSFNGPTQEVTKTNNVYNIIGGEPGKNMGGDLLLFNTSTDKTYNDVKIKMYLPEGYLVANNTMTEESKWVKVRDGVSKTIKNKTATYSVWEYTYGTLPPKNVNGLGIVPAPSITAIPQTGKRTDNFNEYPKTGTDKSGVIPVYAFELEAGAGEITTADEPYTKRSALVKVPYLDPINFKGSIWRDTNNNGQFTPNEGIKGSIANFTPPEGKSPVTSVSEGEFKFENGYAKNKTPEYKLSFTAQNLARLQNFIWIFDNLYQSSIPDARKISNGIYEVPGMVGADALEIKTVSKDDEGNATFSFKVKDNSVDLTTIDFRLKEVLAGKLKVYPFMDMDNNHQYLDGTDSFIEKGTYKLVGSTYGDQTKVDTTLDSALGNLGSINKNNNIFKIPAFDDYTLTYNAPFGFRTVNGQRSKVIVQQRLESLLQRAQGTDLAIELIARDIRFADALGNDANYPNMDKEEKGVIQANQQVLVTLESQATQMEHTLKFNAWKDAELQADGSQKVKLIDPSQLQRSTDFVWELVSDDGILESAYNGGDKVSNDGKITLKPEAEGSAKVKVSWADNRNIFDIVEIRAKKPAEPIEGPGEEVIGFEITPSVTIAKGRKSDPITIKAKIRNMVSMQESSKPISPNQVNELRATDMTKFEVVPTPSGQAYFQVKGLAPGGPYNYTVKYKGQDYTTDVAATTVTVTEHQFTSSSHRLEVVPEVIRVKVGDPALDIAYTLVSNAGPAYNQANAEQFFTKTEFVDPTKAEFENSVVTKVKGLVVGETKLLLEVGDITKEVRVIVYDDNTPAPTDGKIGFEEITNTNGLLNVDGQARYKLFVDLNGDGIKQANEPYVKNSDQVDLSVPDGKATITPGQGAPASDKIVTVKGVNPGTDVLKAKMTTSTGKVYEGEKPLTVVPESSTLNSIALNPPVVVVKQGDLNNDMVLSADYPATGTVRLDTNLYNVTFSNGVAGLFGVQSGKNLRIKGNNSGVAEVKATFEGKEATGKVVVIPADTKLVIKDEPIWMKKNDTKTPEFEFVSKGQPLSQELQGVLKPLVTLTSGDSAVAAPNGNQVTGTDIGKTPITATLNGFPTIKDTKDAFVYDDGALKVADTNLVTNEVRSVATYLENNGQSTPVPAKYLRFKVEDPTISILDPNSINSTVLADQHGQAVKGDLVRVKGVSTAGVRETKLTATIPSGDLSAQGTITVRGGYTFTGPLTVEPSRIDLWTENDKVELVVKDKNGRQVPVDLLNSPTVIDPKNQVEIVDGRIYVKKQSRDATGSNSVSVSLINDPNGSQPLLVPIENHNANTQNQEHELVLTDFALQVGDKEGLQPQDIKIKVKGAPDNTAVPISPTYITDLSQLHVQPNIQPLNGSVSMMDSDPAHPSALKVFKGEIAGASSYQVTVTLPGSGEVLKAQGKIAIYKDLTMKEQLQVVKRVFDPIAGLKLVPLQEGEKVPVNEPLFVQLKLFNPLDDTDVQIISGAALPYFVKKLRPEVGSNFQVNDLGELVQKTPTSGPVKVTGTLIDNPGPLYPSQNFELEAVQPAVPRPGPIKVEPRQLLIPVNGTGAITGITYADGTPVPQNKISIRPVNPTIADNGYIPNTIRGKMPGDTEVYVVVEGYPPVRVPVKVYDETNANVGVNPDPNDPNIGANPNDPNYPGGFPVPNEIVMVPVGGEVPFVLDINGVPVPADQFDVAINSGGVTTHSAIDMTTGKISGLTPGTDTAEFTLRSNPNIKKILKVVVFDPNVATVPSIRITDKPIVFRNNMDPSVTINSVVDLNGAPNATVMWIVEDVGVASFAGTNSLTEPASANPDHSVTLNWETNAPRTTKLTAIVLESGKLDTTILSGKEIEVDYIDYIAPKPLEAEKDVPKSLDAMGPFKIKMYDNSGNEYPLSIADFDVVGASGPITLSGPNNRMITATGTGPKTLKLRHKTSGKEIEIPVSIPEDATVNQAVIVFDPNGGTLTGPATQMVEKGRPTTLPVPTRPGYVFAGWYDASGRRYDNSTPITADVALIARWTSSGSGGSGGGGGGGGGGPTQPSTPPSTSTQTPPSPSTPSGPVRPVQPDKGYIELNKNAKFAYLTGYPDKTVKASAPITRAEVSAIFARLMKSAILMDQQYGSEFGDVRTGVWYTNYIGYLEGFHILTGYPDGSFRPNNHITRAEFAVIISKFAQLKTDTPSKFKDVNDSHWAKKYVDNAVAQGWMGGYPDGSFKPNQPITRAEVVTVVNKMIERTPQKDSLSKSDRYKDLKQDYWAYGDVLEASTDHTVGSGK